MNTIEQSRVRGWVIGRIRRGGGISYQRLPEDTDLWDGYEDMSRATVFPSPAAAMTALLGRQNLEGACLTHGWQIIPVDVVERIEVTEVMVREVEPAI